MLFVNTKNFVHNKNMIMICLGGRNKFQHEKIKLPRSFRFKSLEIPQQIKNENENNPNIYYKNDKIEN